MADNIEAISDENNDKGESAPENQVDRQSSRSTDNLSPIYTTGPDPGELDDVEPSWHRRKRLEQSHEDSPSQGIEIEDDNSDVHHHHQQQQQQAANRSDSSETPQPPLYRYYSEYSPLLTSADYERQRHERVQRSKFVLVALPLVCVCGLFLAFAIPIVRWGSSKSLHIFHNPNQHHHHHNATRNRTARSLDEIT